MSIAMKYRLFDLVDLEVRQDLSFQKKWGFDGDQKRLAWEKYDTSVTGKASLSHALENGTRFNVSVARTQRDATSIVERQRQVWNITANIDKTF
jgi:hypothetical protein